MRNHEYIYSWVNVNIGSTDTHLLRSNHSELEGNNMNELMNWLANEESGQGMVEYGLIIALVSIVVIGILTAMGGHLNELFTKADDALAGN